MINDTMERGKTQYLPSKSSILSFSTCHQQFSVMSFVIATTTYTHIYMYVYICVHIIYAHIYVCIYTDLHNLYKVVLKGLILNVL